MPNLSANAWHAIYMGCSMMGWSVWNLYAEEAISAGLYWLNEYLESIEQYPQTYNKFVKIERELQKALVVALS